MKKVSVMSLLIRLTQSSLLYRNVKMLYRAEITKKIKILSQIL